MKRFFIKFFIFLVPIIIGCIYVEWRISIMPNNLFLKEKYIEKKRDSIEVLALGTSHILEGIDPKYFSHPGFNLANHAQSLYYDIRATQKFIDKLPKLKLVIISIDHFSFGYQIHNSSLNDLDYTYYKYYGITYKDIPFWNIRKYSFVAMHSLGWTFEKIRSNFKPDDDVFADEHGYERLDSAGHLALINDARGMNKANYNSEISKKANRDYIINDLEVFIQFLQHRNIKVVLLTAPAFHTYSDHVDKKTLSENNEIISGLCSKYHLRYFNFFTDNRFGIYDFADNDHLDYLGAKKFSKIVDSAIIKPMLD